MASMTNYTLLTSCTFTNTHPTPCNPYACVVLQSRTIDFNFYPLFSHSALSVFSPWDGLRHPSISPVHKSLQFEMKGKCKGRVVYASLFGVGAPEALVIGVVALLVFGPKGLAEVARNLGKTLRAFQPTIRELQDVSRDFKSSLQREIGLDEIQNPIQKAFTSTDYTDTTSTSPIIPRDEEDSQTLVDPNGVASASSSYSSEELLKITEEQLKAVPVKQESSPIENQLKTVPVKQESSPIENQLRSQTQDGVASASSSYSSEELLKITEEQLNAVPCKQESSPIESQLKAVPVEQDSSPIENKLKSCTQAPAEDGAS